jgi:hypothetical protein
MEAINLTYDGRSLIINGHRNRGEGGGGGRDGAKKYFGPAQEPSRQGINYKYIKI